MSETQKKIAELERRIRELEARPQMPAIIVLPSAPVSPQWPVPWYPQPWQPYYVGDDPRYQPTITCGNNAAGNYPSAPRMEVIQ